MTQRGWDALQTLSNIRASYSLRSALFETSRPVAGHHSAKLFDWLVGGAKLVGKAIKRWIFWFLVVVLIKLYIDQFVKVGTSYVVACLWVVIWLRINIPDSKQSKGGHWNLGILRRVSGGTNNWIVGKSWKIMKNRIDSISLHPWYKVSSLERHFTWDELVRGNGLMRVAQSLMYLCKAM